MSRKKFCVKIFSEEEQRILRENPFTYSVSSEKLYHTKEFKKAFYERYRQGMRPVDIMAELGYDPKILGPHRSASTGQRIREEFQMFGEFTEGYNNGCQLPKLRREMGMDFEAIQERTVKELSVKVKALESKVAYQESLLNFIKEMLASPEKK